MTDDFDDPRSTRGPVRVRSLREFAKLNNLSLSSLRRAIRNGTGPAVVELSPRRLGVRDDDGAAWQESRRRQSVEAA